MAKTETITRCMAIRYLLFSIVVAFYTIVVGIIGHEWDRKQNKVINDRNVYIISQDSTTIAALKRLDEANKTEINRLEKLIKNTNRINLSIDTIKSNIDPKKKKK